MLNITLSKFVQSFITVLYEWSRLMMLFETVSHWTAAVSPESPESVCRSRRQQRTEERCWMSARLSPSLTSHSLSYCCATPGYYSPCYGYNGSLGYYTPAPTSQQDTISLKYTTPSANNWEPMKKPTWNALNVRSLLKKKKKYNCLQSFMFGGSNLIFFLCFVSQDHNPSITLIVSHQHNNDQYYFTTIL